MPYIRQIDEHPTEARRAKLDPHITATVAEILALELTGSMRQCFFDTAYLFFSCWSEIVRGREGKTRYYDFNDVDGVAASVIWEMERRTNTTVTRFPTWKVFEQKDGERRRARRARLSAILRTLLGHLDHDRAQAVGEANYSLSEITLALVNAGKLSEQHAIQIIYAAGRCFYGTAVADYEDASILDPEKGDTRGYREYHRRHPEKLAKKKR